MKVIVDTTVWSLALRRREPDPILSADLSVLLRRQQAILLGVVRQEVLSGVPDSSVYTKLRDQLRPVPDYSLTTAHYEQAAELFSRCRSRGVQGTLVDCLICAVAMRDDHLVFSTDGDFKHIAKVARVELYRK